MAVNVYECMFILDTTKVGGDIANAEKQVNSLLEKSQAEVLASRPWDERRFIYPIKNHKKGLYYLTYFRVEGKKLVGLERECALNEMILRMLVLRIEPKWVDTMLNIAREEHATALHNVTQEPSEDGLGDDDDRPRRRRHEGGRD